MNRIIITISRLRNSVRKLERDSVKKVICDTVRKIHVCSKIQITFCGSQLNDSQMFRLECHCVTMVAR